jgi:fructose-specific phosphotransferase system IIC component
MGYVVMVPVVVIGLGVFLALAPAFRAYRRRENVIGEDGLAHRQRHQDPRLP